MKPSDMPHQLLGQARADADDFDDTFGLALQDVTDIYLQHQADGMSDVAAAVLTLATIMATPENPHPHEGDEG